MEVSEPRSFLVRHKYRLWKIVQIVEIFVSSIGLLVFLQVRIVVIPDGKSTNQQISNVMSVQQPQELFEVVRELQNHSLVVLVSTDDEVAFPVICYANNHVHRSAL